MPSIVNISRYQKRFGVGLIGTAMGWLLLCLLWLLDRAFNHVEILSQPKPIRIVGSALIAIWICWHLWCLKTLRSWWKKDRLCTMGPFRVVRHPVYAGGGLLFTLGLALILNSWIILSLPILSYFIWSALVRKEEKMMETVFGEEYKRYAACTGRLLPRIFRK
jgi:protein-S-isoprenylcysteine O-methyltransferase Ste14